MTPSAVVAGGANIDIKVRASGPTAKGISTPGRIHLCPGGVARNVAEALARMGAASRLLTAVGDDPWGAWLIDETAHAGVDVAAVLRRPGQTGFYITVDGRGIADTAIIESVPPDDWPPGAAAEASLLVIDANLPEGSLGVLTAEAPRLALIGTSPAKVTRLRRLLPRAWLICLTAAEAAALLSPEAAGGSGERLARAVQHLGPRQVLLTEGVAGLGLLGERWTAQAPHRAAAVVDATGAGDVAAATVIFGLAAGLTPQHALGAAAEAAAMTVGGWGNVPPEVGTVWKDGKEGRRS